MQFNLIDAVVHTTDGEAGHIWKVAMLPDGKRVTHVVVHKGLLGRNVVVPISAVARMIEGHVYLKVSNDNLAHFPDYESSAFLDPSEDWDYPLAFPMGGIIWPLSTGWPSGHPYPFPANAPGQSPLPEEDVTLAAGTAVECTDGRCGRIERVLVDETSNEMVGFVIKRGFLFAQDVKAPISWIDHLADDAVYLKLSRKQLAEMATYFE